MVGVGLDVKSTKMTQTYSVEDLLFLEDLAEEGDPDLAPGEGSLRLASINLVSIPAVLQEALAQGRLTDHRRHSPSRVARPNKALRYHPHKQT